MSVASQRNAFSACWGGCLGPICWSGQPLVVQMCLPNLSTEKSQVAWWPERGHRNAEAKQPTYGDSQRTIWIPAKTASYVVLVLGHFQNLIQFCPLLCCKEYIFILQTRPPPQSGWGVFVIEKVQIQSAQCKGNIKTETSCKLLLPKGKLSSTLCSELVESQR